MGNRASRSAGRWGVTGPTYYAAEGVRGLKADQAKRLKELEKESTRLKGLLVVVAEYTRECLSIDVARKRTSDDVLERLAWLMATREVPGHIRSDSGPEFTATVVRE